MKSTPPASKVHRPCLPPQPRPQMHLKRQFVEMSSVPGQDRVALCSPVDLLFGFCCLLERKFETLSATERTIWESETWGGGPQVSATFGQEEHQLCPEDGVPQKFRSVSSSPVGCCRSVFIVQLLTLLIRLCPMLGTVIMATGCSLTWSSGKAGGGQFWWGRPGWHFTAPAHRGACPRLLPRPWETLWGPRGLFLNVLPYGFREGAFDAEV